MEKKVFSCVLIGLGGIGLNYDLHKDQKKYIQTHARAFSLNSGFNLQAGVDLNNQACNTFTKTYNIESFNKIEDALLKIKPDLIILAVPTSIQLESIQKIVNCFSPRAILCEKPMGDNLEQGTKILNICKKNEISLYVNYVRRSLPVTIEIKKRIVLNVINSPTKSVVWYSKGLSHNGSHFVNLMEYWFGKCLDVKIIDKGRQFETFGFEPHVNLKFQNCELTLIPAWEEFYSHNTIEIVSSSGRLYWGQKNLKWTKVNSSEKLKPHSYLSDKSEEISTGSEKYQMYTANELYLAMSGQSSSISSGDEALETLNTIDWILSSD